MPHFLQLKIQHVSDPTPTVHTIPFEDIVVVGMMETPDQNGNRSITVSLKPTNPNDLFGKTIECPVAPRLDIHEIFDRMNSALKYRSQNAAFLFTYTTR